MLLGFLNNSGFDLVEFVGHDVAFCDELWSLYFYDSIVDELLILEGSQL